jgi:hypothetical protein
MIVDELAAQLPGLREILRDAHIFQIPFSTCPYDDSDGRPGLLWGNSVPTGLSVLSDETLPVTGRQILDTSFADPCYPTTVLFGPGDERGCVLVQARKLPLNHRFEIDERFVAMRPDVNQLNQWPPRWWVRAVLIWQPPAPIGPQCAVSRFWLGDRILMWPTLAPDLLENPGAPSNVIRNALRDVFAQLDEVLTHLYGQRPHLLRLKAVDSFEDVAIRELGKEASLDAAGISHIVAIAFSLLNAKNIVREPAYPLPQSRASRRRGDLAPHSYHVLRVAVPSVSRTRGESSADSGASVAIHWVRGHFKRYTLQRPLFGRLTGMYWWQHHLAGRAPRLVEKDYRLQNNRPSDTVVGDPSI